jgi:flavin-dependent dehydrogenase
VARYSFDFGPVTIAGFSPAGRCGQWVNCPRRTALDTLLVEAAAAAGAEVREAFTVEEILVEEVRVAGIGGHVKDGATVTERARVVVGADSPSPGCTRSLKRDVAPGTGCVPPSRQIQGQPRR